MQCMLALRTFWPLASSVVEALISDVVGGGLKAEALNEDALTTVVWSAVIETMCFEKSEHVSISYRQDRRWSI